MLREILDEECIVVDDALDRLLEELGEAGHVDALLRRIEIDGAVDRREDQLLACAPPDPDGFLDAGDACPRQAERHLGGRGLQIVEQVACRVVHPGTVRHGSR